MGLVSNIMRNGVAWLLSTTAMPAQNLGFFAYDHSIPSSTRSNCSKRTRKSTLPVLAMAILRQPEYAPLRRLVVSRALRRCRAAGVYILADVVAFTRGEQTGAKATG